MSQQSVLRQGMGLSGGGSASTWPAIGALRIFGHFHALRYGIRYRLLCACFDPNKRRDMQFAVPFYGMTYRGNFANYLDWIVFFFGSYETPILHFLEQTAGRLGKETTFLDIGANVGHHTLFMAPHCANVHSFEPFELVRNQLIGKLGDNSIGNVTVHDCALGERDEIREYFVPATTNTGAGSFTKARPDDTLRYENEILRKEMLHIVCGDDYLVERGIDRVDLIKMDVEGFEVSALKGLAKTLRKNRPIIIMEYDQRTIAQLSDQQALLSLIGDSYRAFQFKGSGPRYFFLAEQPDAYHLTPFEHDVVGTVVLVPDEKRDAVIT